MASIILRPKRESSLLRRHPWIFSGAIAKVQGDPLAGETVEIRASDGTPLGWGAYSPSSEISVRVWSFDPGEKISPAFFRWRLERAVQARRRLGLLYAHSAVRLVNSESDGLPGLIVDRYGEYLVCQFLSAGIEIWRIDLIDHLNELVESTGIYERSDVDVRNKEGLSPRTGVLAGQTPPDLVKIQEGPYRFAVDIKKGHKTGFYLDQRENRACLAEHAEGAEILNCFAYTGAFAVPALMGGAERVTNLDSSREALVLTRTQAELNGLDPKRIENVEGDVFTLLREYHHSGRLFDLIILDPPKFVHSKAGLMRAARGYKDINLSAFRLLRPGGLLLTFSCSGRLTNDLFQKIVADAALDAGREAQVIRWLHQAADHPTALNFPEGSYLKGLLCRVV
jgi:23S rRNA (cytosine1962-C5)-methyltransferase